MEHTHTKRILLVCTGNICRSPLAAALLQRALAQRGIDGLGGETHVFVLGEYAGREGDAAEVSDPFGGDLEVYRDTCVELEALIDTAVERIVKEFARGGNQR